MNQKYFDLTQKDILVLKALLKHQNGVIRASLCRELKLPRTSVYDSLRKAEIMKLVLKVKRNNYHGMGSPNSIYIPYIPLILECLTKVENNEPTEIK